MKDNKFLKSMIIIMVFIIIMFFVFLIIKMQILDSQTISGKNHIITFEDMKDSVKSRNGYYINTAVLYISDDDNYTAETALEYLNQSVSVGLNVSFVDISKEMPDLEKFDILYLDESIVNCDNVPKFNEYIINYVKNGGNVFVANNLYKIFPKEFIGAKEFVKLNEVPHDLKIKKVDNDLKPLQELVVDFSNLYKDFYNKELLKNQDYGIAVVPDNAIVLVSYKNKALYTINKYGNGTVLYTNLLLPNKYSKSAFSLKEAKFEQGPFSNTTASFNQMIYGYYASYVSKKIYGFSVSRIFGSYTAPSMAWSLHYENIPGIKANTLKTFGELVEKYNQIPSYSIVRNAINWFTRMETVTYLLNSAASKKDFNFKTDLYENPFASGKYVACDNEWLQLYIERHVPPGLGGNINKKVLSFPFLVDYDGDGVLDLFSGSKEGDLYFFKGKGFTGKDKRFTMDKPVLFNTTLPSASSPSLADINGDGKLDIITGSNDGNIYILYGHGNLDFDRQELLIKTDIQGISLPYVGDINSDGIPDIIAGSDTGVLLLYYGAKNGNSIEYSYSKMDAMSKQCADLDLGKYLSPYIVDYNKDGIADIIIGIQDGYVAKFKGNKTGKYDFDGFFLTDEMNINGNYNLKFGMFCNPRLLDINNDGRLDFVVGYEDADLPYPIDSIYFPYKKELSDAINYAKSKNYYIGMHYFLGGYASDIREQYEINTHLKLLKSFGINTKRIGVNQHAGPITKISEINSYNRLYNSGLLWESYFGNIDIHVAAENVVVNPFFIIHNNQRKLLMQNISTAIFCQCEKPYCKRKDFASISSKYESPILNYHHPDGLDSEIDKEFALYVDKYKNDFLYNFVREDQMMYAIAAAYNLKIRVKIENDNIEIIPETESDKFPLYDKNYREAAGIKIELSSDLKDKIYPNASVWQKKGNNLYIGMNSVISLSAQANEYKKNHLIRVNIPAKIDVTDKEIDLSFLDDGMMQAVVTGNAYTDSKDWKTEYNNGETVFTKFGKRDCLHIIYGE